MFDKKKNMNHFSFDKILKFIIIALTIGLILSMIWTFFQKSKEEAMLVNYASKPKHTDSERVVISLWVDEKNVQNLDRTLLSILNQSVRVDMIYVNVAPKTAISTSKLAEKCAIVQMAGKVYPKEDSALLTILREKEDGIIIINLEVSGEPYESEYVNKLLNNRSKDTFLLFPEKTERIDPNQPGLLNSLLSHNLDV